MATGALVHKALRIGVICGGRLMGERLLRRGERVSLGELAPAEWVGEGEDPAFTVFSYGRAGCSLFFDADAKGRLMAAGTVVALDRLRDDPSVHSSGGSWQLALGVEDRGKIAFEKITVLFQFVDFDDTSVHKPLGEMDFRARLLDEDPVYMLSLAMWAGLAAVLGVWVNTQEAIEVDLADMSPIYTQIVFNSPKSPDPEPTEDAAVDAAPDSDAIADAQVPERIVAPEPDLEPRTPLDRAQRHQELREQIASTHPLFIGGRGPSDRLSNEIWGQDQGIDYDEALGGAPTARPSGVGLRSGGGIRRWAWRRTCGQRDVRRSRL